MDFQTCDSGSITFTIFYWIFSNDVSKNHKLPGLCQYLTDLDFLTNGIRVHLSGGKTWKWLLTYSVISSGKCHLDWSSVLWTLTLWTLNLEPWNLDFTYVIFFPANEPLFIIKSKLVLIFIPASTFLGSSSLLKSTEEFVLIFAIFSVIFDTNIQQENCISIRNKDQCQTESEQTNIYTIWIDKNFMMSYRLFLLHFRLGKTKKCRFVIIINALLWKLLWNKTFK